MCLLFFQSASSLNSLTNPPQPTRLELVLLLDGRRHTEMVSIIQLVAVVLLRSFTIIVIVIIIKIITVDVITFVLPLHGGL